MSAVPATSPVPPAAHTNSLSIWRSPVAYLFGGMAAVSMLISSALLLLILSYWKYKNRLNRSDDDEEEEEEQRSSDLESANEVMNFNQLTEDSIKTTTYGEKFAVIMAGDELPRFLASPRCYKGFDLEEEERQSVVRKMNESNETTSFVSVSPTQE